MLIHPWDAVADWRPLLATRDFGQLITVGQVDGWPVVVPTHFVLDGQSDTPDVLLHLARPNPVWRALEQDDRVVLAIATDYGYVDAATNTAPGSDPDLGVPTSYYTAVQLLGRATVLDDPDEKAALLTRQLEHFEPASGRVPPSSGNEADRRLLPGIRGIRIRVERVRAKQKYGGNKEPAHRATIHASLSARGVPIPPDLP